MSKNYVVYHLHDDTSNCNGYADSCTGYKDYIDLAKQQGMDSIAFSNHGGIYDWVMKKRACDKANIKYIHGVELYLCNKLEDDVRGWHIGLYAKNWDGIMELNEIMSKATSKGVLDDKTDRAFYYNPRISIQQLKDTSENIIITTACLASVFWQEAKKVAKLKINKEIEEEERSRLIKQSEFMVVDLLEWMQEHNDRVFLEVQYHNNVEQIAYNKILQKYSKQYNIPLIAGTDTHSSTPYKSECRKILQKSKDSFYGAEDEFDLTWKTYDELVNMFELQNCLDKEAILQAIDNTNVLANMVTDFKLDTSIKYPTLYGDSAKEQWRDLIFKKLKDKLEKGIVPREKIDLYKARIMEEYKAMTKQGMESFMMFMSELCTWCWENDIPIGFARGSSAGSLIAYITDITDVDAIKWGTVFSRFCNEDRVGIGD